MNAVLGQIAIIFGCVFFIIVLVVGLLMGVPVMVILFRAAIVMCLSSLIIAVFFRFLSSILYRFVIEQVETHKKSRAKGANKKSEAAAPPALGGGLPAGANLNNE